jgi:2-keto-3-deoxy-L-rhamnonate aldolase RhmA
MRTNFVKSALKSGRVVLGSEASRFRSPQVPVLYAQAGFDFVFIDMEHSSFSLETVADLILAARHADVTPIVRIPQVEYSFVSRVLDAGAMGIIAPRVNTVQQVRDLRSWMLYPPEGIRGFACTEAQTDGRSVSTAEFMDAAHREILCIVQIERREAVENLEAMLDVPGVDVACLGCMDLSVDLGVPGQIDHPTMVKAMDRVIAVSRAKGIAAGIISPDVHLIERWIDRGMRFVSYATEAILLEEAASAAVRRLRSVSARRDVPGSAHA